MNLVISSVTLSKKSHRWENMKIVNSFEYLKETGKDIEKAKKTRNNSNKKLYDRFLLHDG